MFVFIGRPYVRHVDFSRSFRPLDDAIFLSFLNKAVLFHSYYGTFILFFKQLTRQPSIPRKLLSVGTYSHGNDSKAHPYIYLNSSRKDSVIIFVGVPSWRGANWESDRFPYYSISISDDGFLFSFSLYHTRPYLLLKRFDKWSLASSAPLFSPFRFLPSYADGLNNLTWLNHSLSLIFSVRPFRIHYHASMFEGSKKGYPPSFWTHVFCHC